MDIPEELKVKLQADRDLRFRKMILEEVRNAIPKGATGADIDHILTQLEK